MNNKIKKITSVVLALAVVVSAASFTKLDNANAKETPATPQEPAVLNEENANLDINSLADLIAFRDNVNNGTTYQGDTITLKVDIDMSTIANWDAIGTYTSSMENKPFKGTFEGEGHKISNLKINKENEGCQGLFGYINGATIQNLGVEDVNVKGRNDVGGLVGNNAGTIENCYATGEVTGQNSVGGLVGYNSGTIKNSYATGSVTGTTNVGGLAGSNSYATIENSYATGSVTGNERVGGLVGSNSNSATIKNSYATGKVTGTSDYVGGLVGENGGTIENSYATGSVTGTTNVGGLAGENKGTIRNCYATGSVTGQDRVGGLVGFVSIGSIYTSFAIGRVTGTGINVGGLVGSRGPGGATNCYYDKDTTGQSDTGKGTPLSTAQMTGEAARANMLGFDFGAGKPWSIKQDQIYGKFYPYITQFGEESSVPSVLLPMAITSSVEGAGKVEDIPANAKYGEEINFKAIADTDYKVKSVTSEGLTIEDKGSGSYSFTMPKHAVEIKVVFESTLEPTTPPIPTPEPTIDTDGTGGAGKTGGNAKTGDKVNVGLISLLTLTAAGALLGLKKRKR